MKEGGKCSLCGGPYTGVGHNPEPLERYGRRCCDGCNAARVIPARIAALEGWPQESLQLRWGPAVDRA